MQTVEFSTDEPVVDAFRDFVADASFPCVGAKSALSRGNMHFLVARDIASAWDDMRIYSALYRFVGDYRADRSLFRSFVLLFETAPTSGEEEFERNLWARLQSLSDKDDWLGQRPDPRVSGDPDDPHFSLSFAGEAFFVVGLHPAASRPARRFRAPALVFNLHDQFEQLRSDGRYEKLRSSILTRDVALAGSENPMLARHGSVSEARQYSGRAVGADWRCPFSGRGSNRDAA
ncbi:YqcI/YcgG family protein [Sphingomonas donggukensis]|uniref:YqcI/YcgG family protein n=1 Tax=Sphingomonas donggukensis TaxID=2949093 RepID=A0ABY4TVW1_9SPHN|nr:guanitoxin biosynthesis heme-dependent pre-guanitoxin N-hydroxylase GntA [Sphingomonas donggukensis]URW76544.1 YqcI/YcgG family protein [Sphingomonas donggukensis]